MKAQDEPTGYSSVEGGKKWQAECKRVRIAHYNQVNSRYVDGVVEISAQLNADDNVFCDVTLTCPTAEKTIRHNLTHFELAFMFGVKFEIGGEFAPEIDLAFAVSINADVAIKSIFARKGNFLVIYHPEDPSVSVSVEITEDIRNLVQALVLTVNQRWRPQ